MMSLFPITKCCCKVILPVDLEAHIMFLLFSSIVWHIFHYHLHCVYVSVQNFDVNLKIKNYLQIVVCYSISMFNIRPLYASFKSETQTKSRREIRIKKHLMVQVGSHEDTSAALLIRARTINLPLVVNLKV